METVLIEDLPTMFEKLLSSSPVEVKVQGVEGTMVLMTSEQYEKMLDEMVAAEVVQRKGTGKVIPGDEVERMIAEALNA